VTILKARGRTCSLAIQMSLGKVRSPPPPTRRGYAVSLRRVLPWFENRRKELADRPLIREQAFGGEALDADKLERLARYEVHLDRKLERMLAMLLRLTDLRQGPPDHNPFGKNHGSMRPCFKP
jgi:hypothetical protein